jgi:uncharacterized protein
MYHAAAMRSGISLFGPLLALLLAATGCPKPPATPTGPMEPPANGHPLHLDHAQTNLRVMKLWVGGEEVSAEICQAPTELATGMMFRTNLAPEAGMLFLFTAPHRACFYMKNTKVPLSVAYLDPAGVILEIHDLKPLDETGVEAGSERVQFVLEVNQGWFQRHGVSTGAVVRLPTGSLKGAFRPR